MIEALTRHDWAVAVNGYQSASHKLDLARSILPNMKFQSGSDEEKQYIDEVYQKTLKIMQELSDIKKDIHQKYN